jgi:zona occludens toxin
MPINAFGGLPGSGKSYGVIEHVIVPAVASGRFIISNVAGLNVDKIYQYVIDNLYKDKIICLGHIRLFKDDRPSQPEFFPGLDQLDCPSPIPTPDKPVVNGGDLVVVDEASRYWPMGDKVTKEHATFFREHRHFANVMGQTCDLVVIDPDLTLLARQLRGKIELASVTHQLKSLGLKRYTVRIFRGGKVSGKPQSVNGPYKFRQEIYALYKSHSFHNATESAVDGRQNIFKSKALWTLIGGVVLMSLVGVWGAWSFFQPDVPVQPVAAVAVQPNPFASAVVPGAVPFSGQVQPPVVSEVWRVVGSMSAGGNQWVVLSDPAGRLRVESPSAFIGNGASSVGEVDGSRVTPWSGTPAQKGIVK